MWNTSTVSSINTCQSTDSFLMLFNYREAFNGYWSTDLPSMFKTSSCEKIIIIIIKIKKNARKAQNFDHIRIQDASMVNFLYDWDEPVGYHGSCVHGWKYIQSNRATFELVLLLLFDCKSRDERYQISEGKPMVHTVCYLGLDSLLFLMNTINMFPCRYIS